MDKWFSISHWEKLGELDAFAAISVGLVTAAITLVSVIFAAWLAYRYTRRQNRLAHNVQINADLLKRKIDALEKVWTLLAYMSDRESDYAIFFWRLKKDNPDKKDYFMHIGRLRELLRVKIGEVYFMQHAGLFLPHEVRDLLFAYANKLMGLYLPYESRVITLENCIEPLKSERLYLELNDINTSLREAIKEELSKSYEQLKVC